MTYAQLANSRSLRRKRKRSIERLRAPSVPREIQKSRTEFPKIFLILGAKPELAHQAGDVGCVAANRKWRDDAGEGSDRHWPGRIAERLAPAGDAGVGLDPHQQDVEATAGAGPSDSFGARCSNGMETWIGLIPVIFIGGRRQLPGRAMSTLPWMPHQARMAMVHTASTSHADQPHVPRRSGH
jgi:hypothetical protein